MWLAEVGKERIDEIMEDIDKDRRIDEEALI